MVLVRRSIRLIPERFRAGHFTCKNTYWEKWREPIRKVERETEPCTHYTDSGPDWPLAFFDCTWMLIDRRVWAGNFTSAFLFFILFFFFRKMNRSVSSSPAPDVFPIYLFIYFYSPATPPPSSPSWSLVQASSWKDSSPPSWLFASK